MSFDEDSRSELQDILALIGTGGLDGDAKKRLAALVNQSDEASQIYLEHCQMHAMLGQSSLLASFKAEPPPTETPVERQVYQDTGALRSWVSMAVAACIMFMIGLAAAKFFGSGGDATSPNPQIASVESMNGAATFNGVTLEDGVAVSTGKLSVQTGSIDLRFDHGTTLLVEGPTELTIDSDMQVSLKRGRLAARVSDDAHGFTVLGPDSAVIDLGTEFAMAVQDDRSWVEVYDGAVDVALLNEDGQAWKSRELTASGPVRMDASNGKILDEAPPIALPRLAEVLPEGLAVSTEYVNAVLKSKPAHYWRFEEADSSQVTDVVGDATAAISGGTQLENGGLFFPGGRRNHGLAFVAEPLPSLISNEFTLEAWVNPLFAQKRGLIGINHRAPDSKFQQKLYRLAVLPAQHQTVFPGETFQFIGDLWPYGEEGVFRVFSANQYRVGAWHHVVAVRRNKQLEIYLNGEKAQTAPAPPLKSNPLPTTITIGRTVGAEGETEHRGHDRAYFKGMVDEIAVYPSALSAEEVAEHYRSMQVNIP